MSKTFQAQLLTPEGAIFDGDVLGVQVPGAEGNFEMLHNHAPIVSSLGIGKIIIKKSDDSSIVFAVSGGFVEMNSNSCTMLAEKAEISDNIDMKEAVKERDEIRKKLDGLTENREEAEHALAIAENRVKVADL